MGRDHQRALLIALAAIAVTAAWPGAARAQSDRDRARAHYEAAEQHFASEAYERAAEEYASAYALVPKPGLLFNIGLSYENAGAADKALEHYRRYLAADPEGVKAAEARARSEALERWLADQRERRAAAPPAPRPPEPRRWWPPLIAFGVALGFAGVGVGYAIRAGQIGDELDNELETGLPPLDSNDPRFDRGKRAALIADIGFAGAGLAAVVGAVLTARALRGAGGAHPRQQTSLGLGPGVGLGVEVIW